MPLFHYSFDLDIDKLSAAMIPTNRFVNIIDTKIGTRARLARGYKRPCLMTEVFIIPKCAGGVYLERGLSTLMKPTHAIMVTATMTFKEMPVICGYILSVIAMPTIFCAAMSSWNPEIPPSPRYGPNMKMLKQKNSPEFIDWSEECETNLWEHCGLFEGDIMLYNDTRRNGLLNESYYWPKATIPFYIDSKDFDGIQIGTILRAFEEYHTKTCIRFRPYQEGDANFIVFKGNYSGCWSSVGMRKGGQVLNLNTPKCVTHGIVIHELLHAVGFFHQQSATDRDNYVKIQWENILEKHQHNFNKYDADRITDFEVGYDFGSIMHYSEKAFSKNGNPTIVPLRGGVQIGQRKGLSSKDVEKLSEMYDNECDDESSEDNFDFLQELIKFFQQFFGK